jgi:hypothetical protein
MMKLKYIGNIIAIILLVHPRRWEWELKKLKNDYAEKNNRGKGM